MAATAGLEPTITESKSVVLPLHYIAIIKENLFNGSPPASPKLPNVLSINIIALTIYIPATARPV